MLVGGISLVVARRFTSHENKSHRTSYFFVRAYLPGQGTAWNFSSICPGCIKVTPFGRYNKIIINLHNIHMPTQTEMLTYTSYAQNKNTLTASLKAEVFIEA